MAVTVSVATADKAVCRGGAGNDAGATETGVREASALLLADLITSHHTLFIHTHRARAGIFSLPPPPAF